MSPYLTARGKWLFVTGVIFALLGALVREPMLVLFGQIPFLVLAAALAGLMPAARCLDRRSGRFVIVPDGAYQGVITMRRGDERTLSVWLQNRSKSPLRVRQLVPCTAGNVEIDDVDGAVYVEGGKASQFELNVSTPAVGRCSLQGMDVVLVDRWGLLAAHDYLSCLQVFEVYPSVRPRGTRRSSSSDIASDRPLQVVDRKSRAGTDLRELRAYQPGDPLRVVAWKATVRQRRLISRDFDDEQNQVHYLALDISSSMRAGTPRAEKFEHAVELTMALAVRGLTEGHRVGLWTFDGELYGEVTPMQRPAQRRRIQRHLVGLRSVVAPGRTALDDEALEEALADYLLVQERLDFRGGRGLRGEVDRDLLRRWVRSTLGSERRRWRSPGEAHGIVDDDPGPVRRFFRLRGIPLDPRSEVRAGEKIDGLESVLTAAVHRQPVGGRLTVISDLCGLNDVESLQRPVSVARRRGTSICFLVPFTPHYGGTDEAGDRRAVVVRDLFTRAERQDRLAVAERLVSMGLEVQFVGPNRGRGGAGRPGA